MPNIGPIYRHVLDEMRRRFTEGETADAIGADLETPVNTVRKYTAHLPQKNAKREARRLAILACLDAGLDVRATAEKAGCKISAVVRLIRSERAEEQSRAEKKREEYQSARAAADKLAKERATPETPATSST
jgi:DNA invertase Pin-like site-specific DNA recombinase